MGNQLVAVAPQQILPVEHYLIDLPEYVYDKRWKDDFWVVRNLPL